MIPGANSTQVHLAPLTRTEALYLLTGARAGLLACTEQGMLVERTGFHSVAHGEVLVRTVLGSNVAARLSEGLQVSYRAESMDAATCKGWYATVTGTAELVTDPHERDHYLRTRAGLAASYGSHLLRIRPQLITGHRVQNLTTAANG